MCFVFLLFMVFDKSALLDIGLTSSEVKIYLALLELGRSSVTSISAKSKLHRTNVYDALKKLEGKGLASCVSEDNVNYYSASSPNFLLRLVREKEAAICKILPRLQLFKSLSKEASVSSFKGVSAALECLFSLLDFDEEVLVFNMSEHSIKLIGARILPFHKMRLAKGIKLRQIYSSSLRSLVKLGDDLSFTRFFDDSFLNASFIVCKDVLLIINWSEDILTIKINSSDVAGLFRVLFDKSWALSKE